MENLLFKKKVYKERKNSFMQQKNKKRKILYEMVTQVRRKLRKKYSFS